MMRIRSMKPLGFALAAAAVGALALSGCSAVNPQETKSIVAAVPGVRGEIGSLRVEDLTVVSSGGGSGSASLSPDTPGRLAGTVFNGSSSPVSVSFSTQDSSTVQVTVPKNGEVMLGSAQGLAPLSRAGAIPGGMTTVTMDAGGTALKLQVPVVDGTLAQYRSLLPTPSSTGSPATGSPSGSGSPSSTASATGGATTATPTTTATASDTGRPSPSLSITPSR
ncbi:hypothetical protein [Sinomonas cellulolyticus]|uniref:Lipoprotein n=1 Tax=Sinomonas cellulolyticus TaxID=2801916 RepID=A0ABS1K2S3_9MICC|nr:MULTISPECIES: hypothetical protein [Sinomonas]MBL0705920.1 hypothetical protein [Sinomonas cellulolyticus]